LYGKPPYTAKSPPELLENIKKKKLEFPDDIKRSDEIKELLTRMLQIE
jgi:serine/threonine-protein kinase ULK/ATG1